MFLFLPFFPLPLIKEPIEHAMESGPAFSFFPLIHKLLYPIDLGVEVVEVIQDIGLQGLGALW